MQFNDFNIFTVKTLEEFKELEQKLFSVDIKDDTAITVYCYETGTFYYYKSEEILGRLRLVTSGERKFEG